MEKVLNLELLRNPYNWVVVALMVTLGGIALRYIFTANTANE